MLAGYVQGMSDLLSPILYVMENEVDAFWCFVNFMDEMVKTRQTDVTNVLRLNETNRIYRVERNAT